VRSIVLSLHSRDGHRSESTETNLSVFALEAAAVSCGKPSASCDAYRTEFCWRVRGVSATVQTDPHRCEQAQKAHSCLRTASGSTERTRSAATYVINAAPLTTAAAVPANVGASYGLTP
jgi:hypothetical protein